MMRDFVEFTTVILGFGHCGKTLHLSCLRKLLSGHFKGRVSHQIDVVDPFIPRQNLGDTVNFHKNLPPLSYFNSSIPILHICTPPSSHLNDVREAIATGYQHIVVEKPLAPSVEEARAIEQMAAQCKVNILVVAVWTNSSLTEAITEFIGHNDGEQISSIEVVHNKARFTRTFSRQNEHVFDIEMPHQMSVVLPFMGPDVEFVSAQTSDLMINGSCRATMGRGEIIIKSNRGAQARLVSSLSHPVRERSIAIQFRNGHRLVGNFPVSGDDSYSQLSIYSHLNQLITHEIYDDDPLTNCLKNYYEFFFKCVSDQDIPMPNGAGLCFNVKVVSLLDEAKRKQANYPIHMRQRDMPLPNSGKRPKRSDDPQSMILTRQY